MGDAEGCNRQTMTAGYLLVLSPENQVEPNSTELDSSLTSVNSPNAPTAVNSPTAPPAGTWDALTGAGTGTTWLLMGETATPAQQRRRL